MSKALPAEHTLSPGDLIGHYLIDGPLGRGGMGEVYRAHDRLLGREVAIKLIPASADTTARERFRREARSAAQLDHRAIVRIHHVILEEDRDYIVMELVEGHSLAELLREGPLAHELATALFQEIAEGLAEAHAHGIVHRDVKAANVMVTPEGRAKILDFGIAKQLGPTEASISEPGMIIGSLYTMSPEQTMGERVDYRSDLFSLGVVLYQALTGKSPFQADSVRELATRICAYHPPPVAEVDPRIPRELSDLIVLLLAKDQSNRPRTATEVAGELDRIATTIAMDAVPTVSLRPHSPIDAGRQIPELLPYMPNRADQKHELYEAFRRQRKNPSRSVVCLIPGDELQAQDMYLKRLKEVDLRKLLELPEDRTITAYDLRDVPRRFPGRDKLKARLGRTLADKVRGRSSASVEEINQSLAVTGPVLIHAYISLDECGRHARNLVRGFLDFWRDWPDLAPGQILLVLLFVKHRSKPAGFLTRRRRTLVYEGIGDYISVNHRRLTCMILPALEGVGQMEVEDWARNEAASFCKVQHLVPEIRLLFDRQNSATIPMEVLATALIGILYELNPMKESFA